MKMNFKAFFVGQEIKQGKKTYSLITFSDDDGSTIPFYMEDIQSAMQLQRFHKYDVTVDLSVYNGNKNFKILSIEPISSK